MARTGGALVDVVARPRLGLEPGRALAHGLSVPNLTQTVETVELIARIETFEGLLVAGAIERAVVVLSAVDAEAAQRQVVGVAAMVGGTRT